MLKKDSVFKNKESEDYKTLYKDSVDILGVSLDELEEFMHPSKPTKNESTSVQSLLKKFKKVCSDLDDDLFSTIVSQKSSQGDEPGASKPTLQIVEDIDHLQRYCLKVIESIGANS